MYEKALDEIEKIKQEQKKEEENRIVKLESIPKASKVREKNAFFFVFTLIQIDLKKQQQISVYLHLRGFF